MKHYGIIMIALVLLICTSAFAEISSISAPKVRAEADKFVVPIELNNTVPLAAMDIPFKFSEGVTLEEVTFEGTRSEGFDFKWANIDNDNNTVVIGLIPMIYGDNSDLEAGSGPIANLVFSVDDLSVKEIELEATSMEKPQHRMMLVYNDFSKGMAEAKELEHEFSGISASLQSAGSTLPISFSLKQNAPNPFNPTTRIDYDIPKATHVRLEVFNVLGQRVTTLVDEYQEAGSKSVTWDGRDRSGSAVASGVYFYHIDAGEFSETLKMMMLK
jgi:hypothetical protein